MQEIVLKISDDPAEDGKIIFMPSQARTQFVWNQMIDRGKVSYNDYSNAKVTEGVYKFPWGNFDLKDFLILVSNDNFSDADRFEYTKAKFIDTGLLDSQGEPIIRCDKKHPYEIPIASLSLSGDSLTDIRSKNFVFEPRYDKGISKTLIQVVT